MGDTQSTIRLTATADAGQVREYREELEKLLRVQQQLAQVGGGSGVGATGRRRRGGGSGGSAGGSAPEPTNPPESQLGVPRNIVNPEYEVPGEEDWDLPWKGSPTRLPRLAAPKPAPVESPTGGVTDGGWHRTPTGSLKLGPPAPAAPQSSEWERTATGSLRLKSAGMAPDPDPPEAHRASVQPRSRAYVDPKYFIPAGSPEASAPSPAVATPAAPKDPKIWKTTRAEKERAMDEMRAAKQEEREAARRRREEERDAKRESRYSQRMKDRVKQRAKETGRLGKQVAMGAVAYGIGSSVMGFFSNAASVYMQNADSVRQLKQAYREFGSEARGAGYSIGYVTEQTARLTNALGQQTNSVTRRQFQQTAGFARAYGVEDTLVASTIGSISRMSDREFFRASPAQIAAARRRFGMSQEQAEAMSADISLAGVHAAAGRAGMGGGRFGEYLQTYQKAAQQEFEATGHVTAGTDYAMGFAGRVFGNTERARGEMGLGFAQGVGKMAAGETSTAMRVFMMRALGYGKEGGPKFMDLEEQLEKGIMDPRNANALFTRVREQTAGVPEAEREYAAYMMLKDEGKKAGLNVSGLRSLVRYGLSDDGAKELSDLARDPDRAKEIGFDNETLNKGAFRGGGYGAVGKGLTTTADARRVQLEAMQETVGRDVTKIMSTLGEAAKNLASAFDSVIKELTGQGVLSNIQDFADSVERATQKIDDVMSYGATGNMYDNYGVTGTAGLFATELYEKAKQNISTPGSGGKRLEYRGRNQ